LITSPELLVNFTLARLVNMLGYRIVFVWALTWWLREGVSKRRGVVELMRREPGPGVEAPPTEAPDPNRRRAAVHFINDPESLYWFPGILDLSYLGCFRDRLPRMFQSCLVGTNHTAEACTQEALKRKLTHIGRQNGGACWCGIADDMTSAYGPIADKDCGDPEQPEDRRRGGTREGGQWANAVYRLHLPKHSVMKESSVELWYMGCFVNYPMGYKNFGGLIFPTVCSQGNDVPTDVCAKAAAEQGMTHIAREKGNCHCGLLTEMTLREVHPPFQRPDSECGVPNDDGVRPGCIDGCNREGYISGGSRRRGGRTSVYEFMLPPTTAT